MVSMWIVLRDLAAFLTVYALIWVVIIAIVVVAQQ